MLRSFIANQIAKQERTLGQSLDYVRHIARVSLPAFFKLALLGPLARHRHALPVAAYRVARLVATQDTDCGTCVQIEVNLALQDRVSPEVIRATIQRRPEELPGELADVYHFAQAVVSATGDEEALRERLRGRYGEAGLVELALGIAASRVYPVTKRALGYATSCALIEVKI